MISYNTGLPRLQMREYGRHIQKLVKYCAGIEDKETRTQLAFAIADMMIRLFPELNDGEGHNSPTVWNHINIMSDFKLDIDFPCNVFTEAGSRPTPLKIPYSKKTDLYRGYGSNIVKMIKEVALMEGSIEKDNLIFLLANQMKKLLISENNDSECDQRVFKDIKEISGGAIDIDPENYKLNDYIGITQSDNKKKKKK